MRKFSVVCAFALLLVNPCLSIAATTETTKISTFCRNELQKTSYDRLPWLGSELYSMISKGQVEPSIAQINKIIDIAVKSKNKTLSSDLERLLGDNLFWRQSEIARLIQITPPSQRNLILAMLDNILGQIQSLDASYSSVKIQVFVQLAGIYYHSLGIKDRPITLLSQAIQTSSGVRQTEMRANLLTKIARAYMDIGQPTAAQKTLVQSYQVTQQFIKETKDSERASRPFYSIAYAYAELGNFDRALDIAKSIPNRRRKDETLGVIAGQYIKINQLEKAQKLIPTILDERVKAKLLGQLASAYAGAKNLDVANQIFDQAVKTASANSDRDNLLGEIITDYAQAGQIDTALQAVELIQHAFTKGNVYLTLATEYRKQNQLASEARSVAAMIYLTQQQESSMSIEMLMRRAIETDNTNDYNAFSPILTKLKSRHEILENLGRVALESNQLNFAYLIAETIDDANSHNKNRLLPMIAVAYVNAKQPDKAKQAALSTNNVAMMPYQVDALAQTATAFQKNGQTTLADTTFNQAIQNANALSDTKLRAVAFTIIAREYNLVGQKQLGQQFLTQAIQTAKSVVAPSEKEKDELTGLMLNLLLLPAKQFEQALQVTTEIYNTQSNKANLSSIVIHSLQAGQDDLALKAIQLETNKNVKSRGLINIASSQILRQQKSKAIATLAQAVLVAKTIPYDSVRKIEDTESKASLLEEIALLYAQLGQDKQALQVAMVQDASEVNRVKQRISCY